MGCWILSEYFKIWLDEKFKNYLHNIILWLLSIKNRGCLLSCISHSKTRYLLICKEAINIWKRTNSKQNTKVTRHTHLFCLLRYVFILSNQKRNYFGWYVTIFWLHKKGICILPRRYIPSPGLMYTRNTLVLLDLNSIYTQRWVAVFLCWRGRPAHESFPLSSSDQNIQCV